MSTSITRDHGGQGLHVIITGGAGFIGSNVSAAFLRDGQRVTIFDSLARPGSERNLEWLQAMRWEDNSLGSNFLLDWGTMNQAFAAGQVAMYTSGSDVFTSLVQTNAIDPATYGLAALPLEGDDAGVLTGGTLAAMPADVDEAKKDAAIKWIDFFYLGKLVDEKRAVADAETLVANDHPFGTPSPPTPPWLSLGSTLSRPSGATDIPARPPQMEVPKRSLNWKKAALSTVPLPS